VSVKKENERLTTSQRTQSSDVLVHPRSLNVVVEIFYRLPLKSTIDEHGSVNGLDDVSEELWTKTRMASRDEVSELGGKWVNGWTDLRRINLSPVLSRLTTFRLRELLLLLLCSLDPRDIFGDGSLHWRVIEDGEVLKTEVDAEGGSGVVVDHGGLQRGWNRVSEKGSTRSR
jgi:hypothetical protein